jgi:hypothetical protein
MLAAAKVVQPKTSNRADGRHEEGVIYLEKRINLSVVEICGWHSQKVDGKGEVPQTLSTPTTQGSSNLRH